MLRFIYNACLVACVSLMVHKVTAALYKGLKHREFVYAVGSLQKEKK